jgi:hypothetical protein
VEIRAPFGAKPSGAFFIPEVAGGAMQRDELASKLDAREIGDCLSIALDEFMALFGATDRGPDEAAIKRAVAFAEEHSYRSLLRVHAPGTGVLKTICQEQASCHARSM